MADLRFLQLATDPTLIPGVYNACDQWCDYCPVTARCLAFKCQPVFGVGGDIYDNVAEVMRASMTFLKDCHEAEGLEPPEELVRLLNRDLPSRATYAPLDDPLGRTAKHYAALATAFLMTHDHPPLTHRFPKHEHGPTPFEIFVFYHVLIAIKICRAIVSSSDAARSGSAAPRADADMSAKVALVAIDRSCEALQVMTLDELDPRIDHMQRHLARLRREVEGRFPAARAFVRPGLDQQG
jgi:hypothetical protein